MPVHYYFTIGFILVGFYLLFTLKPTKVHTFIDLKNVSVSIVIPARNESQRILPLLESLVSYRNDVEIIVVDDHSEDNTGAIAKQFGYHVVIPNERPKGWKGKPWALDQGVQHSKGTILIFLDADTIVEKRGIEKLITIFMDTQTPLSIQPYHQMKTSVERLSVFFNVLVVMAANTYTLLKHKLMPRAFFGPTQVMLKQDYVDFATDSSVTNQVLEDIYLGKAFLKNGKRIRSMIGKQLVSFRMYPEGFSDMLQGFGKNFANGAIAIGSIQAILLSLWISAPYASINIFLTSIFSQSDLVIPAVLYLVFGLQLFLFSRQIGNFRWTIMILYPLHALFFLYVFVYSFFRIYIFKNNTWKGRKV
jgi:4,4'-diaponeurosporenoate glycosyltransferase